MKVHTDYLWFNTKKRQEFIRITDDVAAIVSASGVNDGTVLVSAIFRRGSRGSHRRGSPTNIIKPAKTTPTRT